MTAEASLPRRRRTARAQRHAYERALRDGTLDIWAPGTALDGMAPSRAEEVAYGLAYWCDDAVTQRRLVEMISRLPVRVAAFALRRCAFLSVGEVALGMALPGRIGGRGRWLVLPKEGLDAADAHSIIAHEIAHVWRRDDRFSSEVSEDCERETACLVASWGFTGLGADETTYDSGERGQPGEDELQRPATGLEEG